MRTSTFSVIAGEAGEAGVGSFMVGGFGAWSGRDPCRPPTSEERQ